VRARVCERSALRRRSGDGNVQGACPAQPLPSDWPDDDGYRSTLAHTHCSNLIPSFCSPCLPARVKQMPAKHLVRVDAFRPSQRPTNVPRTTISSTNPSFVGDPAPLPLVCDRGHSVSGNDCPRWKVSISARSEHLRGIHFPQHDGHLRGHRDGHNRRQPNAYYCSLFNIAGPCLINTSPSAQKSESNCFMDQLLCQVTMLFDHWT
jgi:hypothetical protein